MTRLVLHDLLQLAFEVHFRHQALAQKLGISPRHLRRLIHDQLGIATTVQAWLNELRMFAAPALLRKYRRAKEVANFLGFKQQAQFSREFKLWFGICPHDFVTWSDHDRTNSERNRTLARPAERSSARPPSRSLWFRLPAFVASPPAHSFTGGPRLSAATH